jgi:hypothetical protein
MNPGKPDKANEAFVVALRRSVGDHAVPALNDQDGRDCDINNAITIHLKNTYLLNSPGGYKHYDCWTIYYYYINSHLVLTT